MSKGMRNCLVSLTAVAAVVLIVTRVVNSREARQSKPSAPQAAVTTPAARATPETNLAAMLSECAQDLMNATDRSTGRKRMQALLEGMRASTNDISVGIRQFLDSKTDASTGAGFKVGANGSLKEAPTLRTWLLDYLGKIDRRGAAAYARTILASSDSPDEWAVSLRDLALGDTSPQARKLLEDKIRELLRREEWHLNPSAGYLEGFDTAVFLGGTSLTPDLATLVREKDNQPVAHAAYLALDRLTIADPAALLGLFQAQPELMQGREMTRADFFARADLRDPQQRQLLESYLLDQRLGAAELQQFAGIFPNANFMISENLLTSKPTPMPGDLAARDAESLKVVNEWLTDPRFEQLRPQLNRIKSRLEEFARQRAK